MFKTFNKIIFSKKYTCQLSTDIHIYTQENFNLRFITLMRVFYLDIHFQIHPFLYNFLAQSSCDLC